jgi:ATP-binding protein involved in chromosome partitioning
MRSRSLGPDAEFDCFQLLSTPFDCLRRLHYVASAMDDSSAHYTPTEIRQNGEKQLSIRWTDGAHSDFDVRQLRLACACAHCIDEWSGEQRLDPATVAADIHPVQIRSVGRYAIGIEWSDGHSTGIYSFKQLRELSDCAD